MRRYAQVIQLRPEFEEEYVRYHAEENRWPGVMATIESCGIRNYSIFLRNGVLFAYFEYHGWDFEADMHKMAACEETQRWWAIMDPMQRPMADALPGEKWSAMREVFHFDGAEVGKA